MKRDAILKLNRILQETTGVNLFNFDKDAMNKQMRTIIHFPNYTYKTILYPVAILELVILAGVAAFCLLNYYGFAIVFFILGTVLAVLSGVFIGIVAFIKKLKPEMTASYELVLKQVKITLMEIGIVDEDMVQSYWEIPPLEEVIRGLGQILVVSFIENYTFKALSYMPSFIFDIVESVFDAIIDDAEYKMQYLVYEKDKQPHGVIGELNEPAYYSEQGLKHIDKLLRDRHSSVKHGINKVALSMKVIGFFVCGFLGLLLGIVYLLMV